MRSIWKGAISFGLVTVPIKLHSAIEEKSFKFNQLHEKDQGRIKMKRTCSVCNEEVPWDEIVKGYEFEKDQYVVLTEDELERGVSGLRTIDILKFVPADQIDPMLFKASYYLSPEGAGVKAYKLLAQSLEDDERVAICSIAFREKEHLATLRVRDGVFVLETMYWPDEVREAHFDELDTDVELRQQEVAMAKSLIDNMTGDWETDEFHDRYRERLEDVVEQKIAGKEITVIEEAPGAKVVDLIEALKASVEATKRAGAAEEKKKPARKKKEAAAG